MEFEEIIRKRTAVRKYSDKKLEKEKLEKILEAGRLAPTAKNNQPFKIYVIESDEGLKKIDESSPCRYNAQTVLLVCGDKEEAFHKENYSTYEMDTSIVTTHMMLEATNLNVDSTWVEMFDQNMIRKLFDLSDNLTPVCLLMLGYKAEDCKENPSHNVRKDLKDLIIYK